MQMGKNKLILLRVAAVFLFIANISMYLFNPLKKHFLSPLGLILLTVIGAGIIAEWFFRKNEIKQKLSWILVFLILVIIYFIL